MNTLLGANWRTTLSGWITVLASAIAINPSIVAFLPETLRSYVTGIAGIVAIVSGGTFAYNAKDKQVTGSSTSKGTLLPLILLFGILSFSAGCAQYEKLTGLSGTQVSQIGSTAEQQTLSNLYTGVAGATTASLANLSGPDEQNGQDVIQAAWLGAGETAGINTLGDLIVDYGGPLLKSLGNYIDSEIGNLPASLQPAAKNTAAAAVQNVINAEAPSGAQPTDDIQSTPAVTGTAVPDDAFETTPIAKGGN
jgi:hypothetical protein